MSLADTIRQIVNESFLGAYGMGIIDLADDAVAAWQTDLEQDLIDGVAAALTTPTIGQLSLPRRSDLFDKP
jgi:hypothetical protein